MDKEQTAIERLRVLVACEESQAVCKAFRARPGRDGPGNEKDEAFFVREMDAQKMDGKHLFGGGFLLSERAAAERAEAEKVGAEKAGAIVWQLSERERLLQQELNRAAERSRDNADD